MEMVSSSGRNCGIVALRTMAKQICKWGLVLGAIVLGACASAAAQSEVTVERGVKVPMRDGVILRADIYRPKQEGRFPVLLERTPYNKTGGADFGYKAAASGYVVIIQDVRGRYTSDGEVGMFGGSYVGATQMLAAIAHPPHLAGICPVVTASNYHSNWTYQGGA